MTSVQALLFDTHCHLDFPPLREDVSAVLDRACAAGIGAIIAVGCTPESWATVLRIAETRHEVWAALGVHPNDAGQARERDLERLRELAAAPRVVAIGETGLDFYRDHTPPEVQRAWFAAQWRLARELGLPVILHCRNALPELLDEIAQWSVADPVPPTGAHRWRGVVHCYSGDRPTAQRCFSLGLMLGVGGPLTYPKSEELRAVATEAPLEALLLETDAPFLAPQPRRGAPNEPAFLRHTAERLAEVRGMTLERLAAATTANAYRLIGRAPRG